MFEEWKQAWREAVDNFRREASLDEAGGSPSAARLRAMEREVAAARSELRRADADLQRTRHELERERAEEATCRRREAAARRIGDEETARLAAGFAARHAERTELLERKAQVLESEVRLKARDVQEMESLVRERLEALGGGAAGAAPGGGPTPRIDPLAEDRDSPEFRRMEREARERAADARLEELKRRMRT
jgi:DNA repair protein SbcC/Rad50